MNKKLGRKPIGEKAMEGRINVRLSGLEYQAIKITAEEYGYKNLSKFMRELMVASAIVKHTMKQIKSESN